MRVLVVDDELLARKRLLRLLSAMDDVTVAGECENAETALARLKQNDIDVILLDIHMPGLSGLEAAALMQDDAPLIVMCTAHADHALEAFDRGVADYVLKPVEAARLKLALGRARDRLSPRGTRESDAVSEDARRRRTSALEGESNDGRGSEPDLSRLAIPTHEGIVLVDPRAVSHAVIEGELITVVTDAATFLSDDSLGALHDRLPKHMFERVHRRALVNLEHIVRLEPMPTGGYLAHMRGGARVDVSRQSARDIRRRLRLR